jgi:hypothetical protein
LYIFPFVIVVSRFLDRTGLAPPLRKARASRQLRENACATRGNRPESGRIVRGPAGERPAVGRIEGLSRN